MSYEEHRWHPTEAQAVSSYYAVYKEATNAGNIFAGASFGTGISIENKMANIKSEFISVLRRLIDYEKSKELIAIQAFITKYGIDKELTDLLTTCLKNGDYTKAFNYIHIKQHNINDELTQLPYDLEEWNKYMYSYMNIYIRKKAEEAINQMGDIGNKTPEQITREMLAYLKTEYDGENKHKNNFMTFMKTFSPELTKLVASNKVFGGKNWNIPTNQIKEITKKSATNESLKAVYSEKIIAGLVNGFSQEEFIVSLFGGASTARATRELKFFTGRKSMDVQTETDMYLILNAHLEPNEQANNQIAALKTDTAIRNFLNELPEDNFTIHYSSKDASISLASKNTMSAKIGKIKGKGSLDSKIPILQSLALEGGFSSGSIDNLIFTIVNSGEGLISQGQGLDTAIEAITNLAIGFMFEDFDYQMSNMVKGISGNEIHLYFLTGKFVPISAILEQFIAQIEGALSSKVVNISISPAKEKFTSNDPYGQERWNFVRENTIKKTEMGIDILNSLLNNLGV